MWTLDAGAGVPLWRPAAPDPAFVLAFSARRGGTSAPPYDSLNLGRSATDDPCAVAENRRRLLSALGLDPSRLATAGQVHGATVATVRAPGHHPGCDALVTRASGVTLAVSTADCMPLLYIAPGAVAAAHAGWRGTASRMPVAALAAVCDAAGVPPTRVRVAIGPCIRPCCYPVGPEVADRFPAAAVRDAGGSLRLDLALAARLQLLEAGVPGDAIEDTGACTSCEPFWYFSHRRDAGATGRHWAVATLIA